MPNQTSAPRNLFRQFVVVLSLALALLAAPALGQSTARVIAIGDVHGDYDAFVSILQQAGLIDGELKWTGGNSTLVQTGDLLDRGPKCRQVMDLLMRLEVEAPARGGRVIALLGNHEAMNILGDLRYAEAMYASFADQNSEKRRKSAFDAYVRWHKARATAGLLAQGESATVDEAAWMTAHPLGFVEQREAMSAEGRYGRWLRQRPAVAKVGTTLFVHGGIAPDLPIRNAEKIVERVKSEFQVYDRAVEKLIEQKSFLPTFTLDEATIAARVELPYRNAELARRTSEAASLGYGPPGGFEAENKHIEYLTRFLGYGGWFLVHPQGPLWFRGYATWNEDEGKERIAKLLADLGVSQIVVGHTPQADGHIVPRFDGKVFLIDTGMLSSVYNGGRASALEIASGKFTAIYNDQRVVLLDTSAHRGEAGAVAAPETQISNEIPGGGIDEQEPAPQAAAASKKPGEGRVWLDVDGKPLPFKNDEEVKEFLRTAKPGKMTGTAKGITHPRQVILEKDGMRVRAFWRTFSEEKPMATMASGEREMNFRDDFIFEPAAYELSLLLGMDNVPPTIVRSIGGEKGSLQIGIEGVFDEGKRLKDKISPPEPKKWNHQIQTMRMFDNLIFNTDRNMGNILIDKDWKVWLIDHSRAFRMRDDLRDKDHLVEIDRVVWEHLIALDDNTIKTSLKPFLKGYEIDGVIKRRKKIIDVYRAEIAKRGESEVVRDMP